MMMAAVGDRLVVRGRRARHGEVLEVRHADGSPPYVVRWADTGRETVCFPGPDAYVEHLRHGQDVAHLRMPSPPCPTASAEAPYAAVRETHSGVVFLLGDRAYKLKKPVDLGFLDFTSPSRRRRACEDEVRLNRRLAADVYLGVGSLEVPDLDSEAVVVMRRMPESRRLSRLVTTGADVEADIRRIARLIASFHAGAARSDVISARGSRDALQQRWEANLGKAAPYVGSTLATEGVREIERLARRFLGGRAELFAERMGHGRVVDGHGDLLADDIFCLVDGPRVLDCLEFDDQLRYVDQLDDLAFLVMDLEHLGSPQAAQNLEDAYLEHSADSAPSSLLHHFIAYRAFVRAMVSCLHGAQVEGSAESQASRYVDQALEHLRTAAVRLVLVGGPPGTGKTTLAGDIADRLGCVVLSSDRVRKELAGVDPEQSAAAAYREGIYSPQWTRRTYEELLHRAERLLCMGESVVVDASWADRDHRRHAADMATRTLTDLVELVCRLDPDTAARRIRERHGPSDADDAVAAAMRADMDPWPIAIPIDTACPQSQCAEMACAHIGRQG